MISNCCHFTPLLRVGVRRLSTLPAGFTNPGKTEAPIPTLEELLSYELIPRKFPILYESLSPESARKLSISLAAYLPSSWLPSATEMSSRDAVQFGIALPPAYHLSYFNPALPANKLLPDGTDPNQSPGEPFVRRMWAGGNVRFRNPVLLNGLPHACVEGIRSVSVKGDAGREKVFVGIERRVGPVRTSSDGRIAQSDDEIRSHIWQADETLFGGAEIIERRNIVFMRERSVEETAAVQQAMSNPPNQVDSSGRVRKHNNNLATFTHTFTPPASLLFRYSALTFNAHAIHLDPQYCREIEGHRNLLVHGPLTLTLLITMLQARIKETLGSAAEIDTFEYRNVAPLYANEALRLFGRELPGADNSYKLWAEGPDGGLAVRASANVRIGHSQFDDN
jgi:hydroxyacyl-ACP dehydratase HTD2-like protein with hotdog domain